MSRLTDEQKKDFEQSVDYAQIIENNKKITQLLNENENLLVSYFKQNNIQYDSMDNYSFYNADDETTSIIIPKEYVLTDLEIEEEFQIEKLFKQTDKERIIKKNCICEIRKVSMYLFFLQRFKIYGGMRKIMYKDIIISLSAVMEQLFKTGAIRLLEYSETTGVSGTFTGNDTTRRGKKLFYYKRRENKWYYNNLVTYNDWLNIYEAKNIIPEFNEVDAYVRYRDLKKIRNMIHISAEKNYIMYEDKLSESMIEKSILGVKLVILGILRQMR